jgi:thioredoxin-related protein
MKRLCIFLLLFISLSSFINWHHNFKEALQIAKDEHKYILLNFSGSDWCGPCIRMHKEFFGTAAFQKYAEAELVLVNADFPRLKKNQLSNEQQKINDAIADKYNSKGSFPLTVLINANGKVVKEWDGLPKATSEEFIIDVSRTIEADKHPN